jgi:hypothetical protein
MRDRLWKEQLDLEWVNRWTVVRCAGVSWCGSWSGWIDVLMVVAG